jgi:hypothetical protein
MSNDDFTILLSLKAVVEHCVRNPQWLVLVTPSDGDLAVRMFQLLQGLVPAGSEVGGRTILLPGRGRISVVRVTQRIEAPGYTAMLFGFAARGQLPGDEIALHEWRNAGVKLVSFDEAGKDLIAT